jgi:negative regulator of sigma-B (phosphoserine phosphatase)
VRIDNDHLVACSVGNVYLRAEGVRIPVVLSPGVLGGHVRHFLRFEAHIGPGARIAIFSDGLSSRFSLSDTRELTPQEACDRLLAAHRHHHDDSTVLIIDFED